MCGLSVEYKSSMVKVAKQIIKKEILLFEGIYELASLIIKFEANMDDITQEVYFIDSEIDNLPLGKVREYCSKEFLERIHKIELLYENDILHVCKLIIKKYKD